jgi:hypothetical protein
MNCRADKRRPTPSAQLRNKMPMMVLLCVMLTIASAPSGAQSAQDTPQALAQSLQQRIDARSLLSVDALVHSSTDPMSRAQLADILRRSQGAVDRAVYDVRRGDIVIAARQTRVNRRYRSTSVVDGQQNGRFDMMLAVRRAPV